MRPFALALMAHLFALPALAHENEVTITRAGDQICIQSNGAPSHDMGTFPNRGNPHSFSEQQIDVCVDGEPEFASRITENVSSAGISVTGIFFRPGTADYYDPDSPRGFSRDPSSGWHLEGMGAADQLGMDAANAHVDQRGLYHYHAVSDSLTDGLDSSLIGWAADGFEIHYIGSGAQSSWQLQQGTRPTAPFGAYDGTYVQDWEFVEGSGNLDECNGAMVDGQYMYFATDTYPFFPRCFRGAVSPDFLGGR